MSKPRRWLDAPEQLTPTERRVLASRSFFDPPPAMQDAIWQAIDARLAPPPGSPEPSSPEPSSPDAPPPVRPAPNPLPTGSLPPPASAPTGSASFALGKPLLIAFTTLALVGGYGLYDGLRRAPPAAPATAQNRHAPAAPLPEAATEAPVEPPPGHGAPTNAAPALAALPANTPPSSLPPSSLPPSSLPPSSLPPSSLPPSALPPSALPPSALPPATAAAFPAGTTAGGDLAGASLGGPGSWRRMRIDGPGTSGHVASGRTPSVVPRPEPAPLADPGAQPSSAPGLGSRVSDGAPARGGASLLREESASLEQARRAIQGGDARRGLVLVEQAKTRFAKSLLSQEWEVLAIEALWRAGQRPNAAVRAKAFLRAYPASMHAERLRSFATPPPG